MNTDIKSLFDALAEKGFRPTNKQQDVVGRLQASGWEVVGVWMFPSSLPSLAVTAVNPASTPCRTLSVQATLDACGYPTTEQYAINGVPYKEVTATRGTKRVRRAYLFDYTSSVMNTVIYTEDGEGFDKTYMVNDPAKYSELCALTSQTVDAFSFVR